MFRSVKAYRCAGNRRKFAKDEQGAAAVEMALVFPLFIMLLLAIFEIGQAVSVWNEVNHALGRAVRLMNVDTTTTTAEISAAMRSYLTDVDPDKLTVTAVPVTLSGIEHIRISVGVPFEIILPFADISTIQINVDRTAPVLSATK